MEEGLGANESVCEDIISRRKTCRSKKHNYRISSDLLSGDEAQAKEAVRVVLQELVIFVAMNGLSAAPHFSHIIRRVACGDRFTLFLTVFGEVYCCGVYENIGRIADQRSCLFVDLDEGSRRNKSGNRLI